MRAEPKRRRSAGSQPSSSVSRTRSAREIDAADAASSRDAVLRSSLHLFQTLGFPGATVQRIVEGANVSKGAFYHWFASKDEVLQLIHDQFIDDQLERAWKVVNGGHPPDIALALLIQEMLDSVEHHRAEISVFLREYRFLSEDSFASIKTKRDALGDVFINVIKLGIKQRVFRKIRSPEVVAFGVIGMCAWATEWYDQSGPLDARSIAQVYSDVLVSGLRA